MPSTTTTSFFSSIVCSLYLLSFPILNTKAQSLTQNGTKITINDKVETVAWRQWQQNNQTRTGISDPGLERILGIETLSNDNYQTQPLQWFSLVQRANVSFEYPYRYVDITELIKVGSLDTQIAGDNLILKAPVAKIERLEKRDNLLVLYLDRPVFWQLKQSTIILRARPIVNFPDIENQGEISQIKFNLSPGYGLRVRGQINPNRLLIEIRPDAIVAKTIKWQPGITLSQNYINLSGTDSFFVTYLEIDPKIFIAKVIFSNPAKTFGLSSVSKMNQDQMAIAGINGGFFDRNIRQPLGAIKKDGTWLSSPILKRGSVAWDDNGNFKFGRLDWQETISNKIPIVSLNSGYIQPGISRYTSAWDQNYTARSAQEIVFSVENNQIKEKFTLNSSSSALAIPENGYLLVLRDLSNSPLKINSYLELDQKTIPEDFNSFNHILGAGPLLLQNGQIVLDAQTESFKAAFQKQNASRSGVGITGKGTILLVAAHERLGAKGPNLNEFAQLMKALGVVDGLNLDGGSSTSLYLGGQTIDRPFTAPAKVNNSLSFFRR
ncbi:MAG: phosphodiester glycosidase family protein [Cyanobacteriota bacterium ELA615]